MSKTLKMLNLYIRLDLFSRVLSFIPSIKLSFRIVFQKEPLIGHHSAKHLL